MSRLSYCLLIVCSSCMPAITFAQDIPAPLAYWNFDENVVDQSGNGNGGTLMGAAAYDADVPAAIGGGSSLSLSGDATATDYVDLNAHVANFAGLAEGTISAWFKTTGAGVDTILAASDSSDGSSELRVILEGGRAWLDVREEAGGDFVGAALLSRFGVNDDSWHHVGITVDASSNAQMYIDGEFVSSTREPFFSAVNDIDVLSIGRNVDSGSAAGQWFFDGLIDDLAVWSEVLSCGQIVALANGASPLGGVAPSVACSCDPTSRLPRAMGYWNFDDNVDDQSGHGYDGILVGGAYDADVPATLGTGKSLLLDRANMEYVDLSAHLSAFSTLTEGTLSAWVQVPDNTIGVIFAVSDSTVGSNELRFFIEGGATLQYGVRSDGNRFLATSTVNVADGNWHHVAAVSSAAGNRVYLDGLPLSVGYANGNSSATDFIADVPNLDTMSIGRNVDSSNAAGQWFYGGRIDDLAIFDTPLTCGQVAALAAGTPVPTMDLELPAPLAYWNFDENVVDQSGNGNDGTLMGAAGYDVDVPAAIGSGSSLSLSGDATATDYVDLNAHVASFAGLTEGTISGWFKTAGAGVDTLLAASQSTDGSSELRVILEGGRAWLDVREEAGGDFVGGALFSPFGVNDDSWHHVGITVDATSNARMYIDGEFVSSTREPFFSAVNDIDVLSIGRNVDSGNAAGQWFFDGLIDDLAVWSEVLTCGEIAALASGVSPLGDPSVGGPACSCEPEPLISSVGHWTFDDNADDQSGLGNHGTLVGGTFVDDVPAALGGGKSLLLDRANMEYVDLNAHLADYANLTEGTISAWIKVPDSTIGVILAVSDSTVGSNELRFFIEGGATLQYGVRSGGNRFLATSTVNVADGNWHHVAAVSSADGNRVYLDGLPLSVGYSNGNSSVTDFIADVPNLDTMSIGRNVDSGDAAGQWFYGGNIDEVAIFNKALSCGQIATLASGAAIPQTEITPPPAAPTGLVVTRVEDALVALDWDDNTEENLRDYSIYRSETSGGPYDLVASGVGTSEYVDTTAVNGVPNFYVVTALNTADDESEVSGEVEATPLEGLDVTSPAAPTGLLAAGLDSQVVLGWADNDEADLRGYNIYRSETSGGPFGDPIAEGVAESEYTDGDVVNDVTYYYVVTAVDNAGDTPVNASDNESAMSAEASATPTPVEDLPMPFAYWPLNEGAGQMVNDLSGNGFHGLLGSGPDADENDPSWSASVADQDGVERGPVLDFAGGDTGDLAPQWVDLTAHVGDFAALDQGTISAWVKLPGGDVLDTVLAASDANDPSSEMRFFYDTRPFQGAPPGIRYDVREGGDTFFQLSSFTDVGTDTWRHVAVTVDGDGLTAIYVDGFREVLSPEVGFFSAVNDLNAMFLGRNVDSSGGQWNYLGQLSDVAVWGEALAANQVTALARGLLEIPSVPPCPLEGDTTCELVVEGPPDNGPGTYGITVTTSDASGDTDFIYSFTVLDARGLPLGLAGPQPENTASFDLVAGTFTVEVEVDDDPECSDPPGMCSTTFSVCPGEGDTTCELAVSSAPPGNVPGTYEFTASATDASGDADLSYTFTLQDATGAVLETVGPQPENIASFVLDAGMHTVTVVVDDDPDCSDPAGECATAIDVVPESGQIPGDINQDGTVDITDAVGLLGVLFVGEGSFPCATDEANVLLLNWNGGDGPAIDDAVALLNYLFNGGPAHVLGEDCVVIPDCPVVCTP